MQGKTIQISGTITRLNQLFFFRKVIYELELRVWLSNKDQRKLFQVLLFNKKYSRLLLPITFSRSFAGNFTLYTCVDTSCIYILGCLTLNLPTWRIWWAPNNASKWQMGFNLAFKGLNKGIMWIKAALSKWGRGKLQSCGTHSELHKECAHRMPCQEEAMTITTASVLNYELPSRSSPCKEIYGVSCVRHRS